MGSSFPPPDSEHQTVNNMPTTLIAQNYHMRIFSEMASSFYSTVSLVTEKLTNFKAGIYVEMKSLKHSLLLHQINKLI